MKTSNTMTKPQVFISYSYSGSDLQWLQQFVRSLEENGVKTWFIDNEVRPGDSFLEAMEKGMRDSDIFVFLLNEKSLNRKNQNIFFELGAAIGMGKRIIGIVTDDMDISLLPQPFRIRKCLTQKSPEETAMEVAAATIDEVQE
ncbi:MAG: toll/interleukin-1 receptor domain-containing protein [Candidatus Omnitrophota bacterium]